MSESNLTTAVYYEQEQEARAAAEADASSVTRPRVLPTSRWEHATSRISLIIAGVLAVCLAVLGIACLSAARDKTAQAKRATYPIDWLLRFGGAKPDQTFQRFIKDSTERNDREWEDRYRDSPAYKHRSQPVPWQIHPAPILKGPRSR